MTLPQPDINHIRAEDLGSDERLKELYIGAVRHGYWRNSAPAVLEFAALAEKAVQDDQHGTPGKLFYSLIKRKDSSMVTQAAENRAMARFPSYVCQEMVDAARTVPEQPLASVVDADEVQQALVDRDVGYAHAVMMQCFLAAAADREPRVRNLSRTGIAPHRGGADRPPQPAQKMD